MAEWLKAHAWKACLLERVTWVRIPLSPPFLPASCFSKWPPSFTMACLKRYPFDCVQGEYAQSPAFLAIVRPSVRHVLARARQSRAHHAVHAESRSAGDG